MTRAQETTLGVLSVDACRAWLIILFAGSQAYQSWSQQPLGPTLGYPTQLELPATWTASPAASQPTLTATSPPTLTLETETPPSPFLACNNLPTMTILGIGTDI